jgi:hypothetical protein
MESQEDTNRTAQPVLFKKTFTLLLAAVGMGVVFDYLFFGHVPGISFPIYIVLAVAALWGVARYTGTRIPRSAALLAVPLLFFAGMVAVWSGALLRFFDVIMSLYLYGLMVWSVFKPHIRTYRLMDYVQPLYKLPFQLLERCFNLLAGLGAATPLIAKHKAAPQVIRGVLIAIPVLAVFVILFASADLVFGKFVADLFSVNISGKLVAQLLVIAMVSGLFSGMFGYIAYRPKQEPASKPAKVTAKQAGQWQIEATILFGSLNVLFLLFIAIQLTYLFGGQDAITHQGFTYAQYARKGYFELIAAAVVAFGVILGADKVLSVPGARHLPRFKVLAAALIAQVIVIMVSAFNRLSLYESAYGFTSLRLYSHICIIWLAVIFALLLYKIVRDQRESMFALWAFVSVLVLLMSVNIVNVDKYVAHKNIARYNATGKIDLYYLRTLSNDALPETVQLLDAKDQKLSKQWAGYLYARYQNLDLAEKPWQSANVSRTRALHVLRPHADYLRNNWYIPPSDYAQPPSDD